MKNNLSTSENFQSTKGVEVCKTPKQKLAVTYIKTGDHLRAGQVCIESQLKEFNQFGDRHNLKITANFGGTTRDENLKEFDKMLLFIAQNNINYILVYTFDNLPKFNCRRFVRLWDLCNLKGTKILYVADIFQPNWATSQVNTI